MPFGLEKDGRKIAIEVKNFLGKSPMTELERALAQYFLYRFLLERREPERTLYLALPDDAYDAFLNNADARDFVAVFPIRIVTFDADTERIVEWKE